MSTAVSDIPRTVTTAAELFAGLQSPDRKTRMPVLLAVSRDPAVALGFGLHEGHDVIDILLNGAQQYRGQLDWFSWVTALAGFRDRRAFDFFIELLLTAANTDLLSLAGEYLRKEAVALVRMRAGAALFDDNCPHRVRTVAALIRKAEGLSLPERIRTGILSETGNFQTPAFDSAQDVWLGELKGPFAVEAKAALEAQGATVIQALLARWDELEEEGREWLLAWSVESAGESFATDAIHCALVSGSEELVALALAAAADLRRCDETVNSAATRHLKHPEARLRRLAYRIAQPDIDWHALLSLEPDPAAAAVCVARMAECNRGTSNRELIDCLRDGRWQVRAIACDILSSLGATIVNEICPLVQDSDPNVRIAVASILVELGEPELLKRIMSTS